MKALEEDYGSKIHLVLSDIPTEGFHGGYGYGYGYGYGRKRGGYGTYGGYGYGYGYGYGRSKSKKGKNKNMSVGQQLWLMADDMIHKRKRNPYSYYAEEEG